MKQRIHNTDCKELSYSKYYPQKRDLKPDGLWYGINNEWLDWCCGEMPDWIKKYLFELDIDETDILIISSKNDLTEFCKKYRYDTSTEINWKEVRDDYKGIEIENYHDLKWSNNLSLSSVWFYIWDVSGGCIWDLTALNGFTRIDTPKEWLTYD